MRSSAVTIFARKYGIPHVLYEIVDPFSSTVTLSRGSSRFARDAAVSPAAFPPMMRMFSVADIVFGISPRRLGIETQTDAGTLKGCRGFLAPFQGADVFWFRQPGLRSMRSLN